PRRAGSARGPMSGGWPFPPRTPPSMLPRMLTDMAERSDTNVIVVGAGPTGLLLAGDLAAAGIRTTLVEKHAHGSDLTRAFVVHARTLEQLDQRGLAEPLIERGRPVPSMRLFDKSTVDLSGLRTR